MKLTGKCKQDFEKWLCPRNLGITLFNNFISDFFEAPQSMQYGVLVDFFDGVGIRIYLGEIGTKYVHQFSLYDGDIILCDKTEETRQEAREKAIIKACEIYNKQTL